MILSVSVCKIFMNRNFDLHINEYIENIIETSHTHRYNQHNQKRFRKFWSKLLNMFFEIPVIRGLLLKFGEKTSTDVNMSNLT